MDVEIRVDGLDELREKFAQFDEVAVVEIRRAMGVAVETVGKLARAKAPVNLGHLRASITTKVTSGALVNQVQGIVGAYQPYARVVEEGADPHWPNMANLHYWVVRKLGLRGSEAQVATFLIARAISRGGLRPQPYMRPALEEAKPKIKSEFEQAVARILEKLELV